MVAASAELRVGFRARFGVGALTLGAEFRGGGTLRLLGAEDGADWAGVEALQFQGEGYQFVAAGGHVY